jgi:hypothetical protein
MVFSKAKVAPIKRRALLIHVPFHFSQKIQKPTKNITSLSNRYLGFPGQKILEDQRTKNSAVSISSWNSNIWHNPTINSANKTAHITANYGFSKIKKPKSLFLNQE